MATLHPHRAPHPGNPSPRNPLPRLLHTPGGLALLELQGALNVPAGGAPVAIGRLDFPDYDAVGGAAAEADRSWMRRAYLWVGRHQRLTGEVRRLPRAVAVVRRREGGGEGEGEGEGAEKREHGREELEVVDIVRYKLVFSSRPEPVGTAPG